MTRKKLSQVNIKMQKAGRRYINLKESKVLAFSDRGKSNNLQYFVVGQE